MTDIFVPVLMGVLSGIFSGVITVITLKIEMKVLRRDVDELREIIFGRRRHDETIHHEL